MDIILRARWGARYRPGFTGAPSPARRVWLHHSETVSAGPLAPLAADVATVQALEEIGQQRFGGGISYTYAVTESGLVFEGTGPGRVGAHTKGDNTHSCAIVLVGGYMTRPPTERQQEAVAALLVAGARSGWWERPSLAGGHRDAPGASTKCPGDRAYALIGQINARAAALWAGGPDDMFTEDDRRKLDRIHGEATRRLPNRRGSGGATIPGGGEDTVLGFAANGDGFAFRAERVLSDLELAIGALHNKIDLLAEHLAARGTEDR